MHWMLLAQPLDLFSSPPTHGLKPQSTSSSAYVKVRGVAFELRHAWLPCDFHDAKLAELEHRSNQSLLEVQQGLVVSSPVDCGLIAAV